MDKLTESYQELKHLDHIRILLSKEDLRELIGAEEHEVIEVVLNRQMLEIKLRKIKTK